LGGLLSFPHAVGVAAWIISLLIEESVNANRNTATTTQVLRRIFFEEKLAGVRDSISNYVDRFKIFFHDQNKLLNETRQAERELSQQLTTIRDGMLNGSMNSYAMKVWVNGAAFHTQMLIHIARLERSGLRGSGTCTVEAAIKNYQRDLCALIEEYETYKAGRIKFRTRIVHLITYNYIIDEEQKTEVYLTDRYVSIPDMRLFYIDRLFSNDKQFPQMKRYFQKVLQNLDVLIADQSSFQLPTR
jgi:hypothetical protein